MALSLELQTGKAGEHFVCADLIYKGYNAFLADQGLPFDIIVEKDGGLWKIQVKTVTKRRNGTRMPDVYTFNPCGCGKNYKQKATLKDVDIFAFVAMDIKQIAYIRADKLINKSTGDILQYFALKTKTIQYKGRIYNNGAMRKTNNGKFIEDYPLENIWATQLTLNKI